MIDGASFVEPVRPPSSYAGINHFDVLLVDVFEKIGTYCQEHHLCCSWNASTSLELCIVHYVFSNLEYEYSIFSHDTIHLVLIHKFANVDSKFLEL